MTLNKAQKLVRMVELMNRRGGVRAREFMDRFDIEARTLRRYLADLRALGLPIQDHGVADDRTIALDPDYRRTGVQLTLPEVLSLHFGRTLFDFLQGTQFADDLETAIERLQPAIPRAHAEATRDLERKFMAVPEHAKDYGDMGEILDEIITALIYSNPARTRYTRADGQARHYRLEPWTLATYRQGLYLFARDCNDGRVKTFAVERFDRFDRLRLEKFRLPPDYRPQAHVASSFGITSGDPETVVLHFSAQVAPWVQERRWHASQELTPLPDGGVRLRMRVAIGDELMTWLLGFAGQVRVLAPGSLARRLRDAHALALERMS